MSEVLYGLPSLFIAGILLALMVGAIEVGHRLGRRDHGAATAATREHITAIQSSLLGILGLLLAFSFSLALQRFDRRNAAVVDEANAIGTTLLRAELLPASMRSETQALVRRYIDVRVASSAITLDDEAKRQLLIRQAQQMLDTLWQHAIQAAAAEPNPVTTGLYIQSLNETIDEFSLRDAALTQHVPEAILLLLFCAYVLTGGVVGYAAGVAGHRPSFASYLLVGLIVSLAFIIVDLDRPRRGLIRVDQSSLRELQSSTNADR